MISSLGLSMIFSENRFPLFRIILYPRITSASVRGAPLEVAAFAVARWMKPPPSTRACPEAAS
jgi:hypothetical protein